MSGFPAVPDMEAFLRRFFKGGGGCAEGVTQTLCQDLKIENDAKILKFWVLPDDRFDSLPSWQGLGHTIEVFPSVRNWYQD